MGKNNLITQVEASEIAGVTKQAINKIKNVGTYNFFVGTKVDTDSQDWHSYLHERQNSVSNIVIEKTVKVVKPKPAQKVSKKKITKKASDKAPSESLTKPTENMESAKQKNALSGGVDLSTYIPQNIADVKRLTEIQKLKIEMQVRLGELVEKEMIISVLNEIGQNIQSHFVDLPRRTSELICQKLDRVGMEKEVEQIITTPFESGIRSLKLVCQKTTKIKYDNE